MSILIWIPLFVVPWVLGRDMRRILYRKGSTESREIAEPLLTGICMMIGMGEAAHLAGAFFHWKFSMVGFVFVSLWAVCFILLRIVLFCTGRKREEHKESRLRSEGMQDQTQRLLLVLFGVSVLLQIVVIFQGRGFYEKDMTLETVQSFLAADAVYEVNPLTGQAYSQGLPLRIRILSLPTFYGVLCHFFRIEPQAMVLQLAPIWVLCCSYLVYGALVGLFFPGEQNGRRRAVFLLAVSVLLWLGCYGDTMDGFLAFQGGYTANAIRSLVLIPFTLLSCLKKRWLQAVFCILAEACIMWTFYGLGVCFLVTVLCGLITVLRDRADRREGTP